MYPFNLWKIQMGFSRMRFYSHGNFLYQNCVGNWGFYCFLQPMKSGRRRLTNFLKLLIWWNENKHHPPRGALCSMYCTVHCTALHCTAQCTVHWAVQCLGPCAWVRLSAVRGSCLFGALGPEWLDKLDTFVHLHRKVKRCHMLSDENKYLNFILCLSAAAYRNDPSICQIVTYNKIRRQQLICLILR